MNVLMWFQQDLRAYDHAALTHAAGLGAVVPLYIFDPEAWARPDHALRQFQFLCESLEDLRADLAAAGAALLIRLGPPLDVLQRLCIKRAITCIVTATPPAPDLANWAAASGIHWTTIAQPETGEPLPLPALRCPPDLIATPTPPAQMLRLAGDPCPHRQRGGRSQALDLLETFLTSRGESYHRAQDNPLTSERASSRLSPHLTYGTLSLREINAAIAIRLAERPAGRWASGLQRFQAQLSRRTTGSEAAPHTTNAPALSPWISGETGLPFLDAVMRYLAATGWLNQHLRGLVLSLACHHLGVSWQSASAALARRFTDYDPALFWPEARRIAGQTATAPRLFHPVKQAQELDPAGVFTRRWLPELSVVPDSCLQTPWKWAGAARLLGRRYPEPLIDITTAHRDAREAIWARHGKPLRALAAAPLLIEDATPPREDQPKWGQLRLQF
jgi:deoxyribodipyrimidine photo-lyase